MNTFEKKRIERDSCASRRLPSSASSTESTMVPPGSIASSLARHSKYVPRGSCSSSSASGLSVSLPSLINTKSLTKENRPEPGGSSFFSTTPP